jgi:predicted PurR-regulated permease PerM
VPYPLQVAAAVCWRVLVLAGAIYVLITVISTLRIVVIPVAIGLLLAALLGPLVSLLTRHRVPRALATVIALISGLAVLGGLLTFVVEAFIAGLPDLQTQVGKSITTIQNWLVNGPMHMSRTQLQDLITRATNALRENQSTITSGALSTAASVGEFLTGFLLAMFTTIFFLYDGRRIWRFFTKAVPASARGRVRVAGERSFASLVGYVRAVVIVAVVDAVGIGIGLWVVGTPLVIPLAALVFLAAFIPTVGAVLSGVVAVLITLVTNGFISAVIVLGVVIAVQQLEGHVLQPLLLGRAVQLHPLAVVLSVACGLVVAGIPGALLAVPLVAVLNAAVKSLNSPEDRLADPDPTDPDSGTPPSRGSWETREEVLEQLRRLRARAPGRRPSPQAPGPHTAAPPPGGRADGTG